MRPLRLDLAGFAVFREPTVVDLSDADYFALVGPTGSGKSTVLDAICFALYGTVPRWGDRRAIANALAPSATEARVRLVFECAGARYVLVRVVRRDGKGAVSTKGAALEALPAGFDLSAFDAEPTGRTDAPSLLGQVLAGTPSEVDAAVVEVIGLPYEQFVKCVVLPQGEFAAFLHAKPAERQRILVNLLGLEVYGQVREKAGAAANAAAAQVAAVDQLLAALADADEAAVGAARLRLTTLERAVADFDALLPELTTAQRQAEEATERRAAVAEDLRRLAAVAVPKDTVTVVEAVTEAAAAATAADTQVAVAEEAEEKLRAQLSSAADPTAIRQVLDAYADRRALRGEAERLAAAVATATARHAEAEDAMTGARAVATAATERLELARQAYQAAVAADRAAALRPHLRQGQPCPVCEQTVGQPPTGRYHPAEAEAKAEGTAARAASDAAQQRVAESERLLRQRDRDLADATARADQVAARMAAVEARLATAPGESQLLAQLAETDRLRQALADAADGVRAARAAQRSATTRAAEAGTKLAAAWRTFDGTRDTMARLDPPAPDRDDLYGSWQATRSWAMAQSDRANAAMVSLTAAVERARELAEQAAQRVAALFAEAGLGHAPAAPAEAARVLTVELERARAQLSRASERMADAERLREQRAASERRAQLSRTLATQLRSDRFERWLLAEALDGLVDGASRILRELSNGQYDLGHDKGEFFVVDHHDAGMRRAVRTLSGGETFQASLALALALAEQLAGMSATSASLESIILDEGFGTLDASTLDTVAATLENLAARGDRMVGVVTHVPSLAERIPVRFTVAKDARTARVIREGL